MALTEHAETLHRYATALQLAGFDVDVETWGGPTDLRITVPNVGWLLLASGFNREDDGWEAVLEVGEGDQTPLVDGPAKGCDSMEIVQYVRNLTTTVSAAGDVLTIVKAVSHTLHEALAVWQDAPDDVSFLLNDGFPFSESLEDVAAKVDAYVTALDARLGRA